MAEPEFVMQTTTHHVTLRYTREELRALFTLARAADVERGGRYDARGAAINVWTHRWDVPAAREASELMGSVYVSWLTETVWLIACEDGFSLADVLRELGVLEAQALGYVKHGHNTANEGRGV